MLFKGLIGCIYRSLKEMCLTPAVKSNPMFSVSTRICHTFRLIQNKLEVLELPL